MRQEQEPAGTAVTEVGPAVLRMQLPIQMPGLGHVNCYALLDSRGAAVVDPGMPGPATWKALTRRLKDAGLRIKDVHTVVVTHSHPDHFGTAGRLAREAGAELVTHSAFRTWWPGADPCDDAVHDVDPADMAELDTAWNERTPWGGQRPGPSKRRRFFYRLMWTRLSRLYAAPNPTRRVRHGETLKLAGREWTAIHTPGHTLDHLCLHDPTEGILLTGDHVLPTITPHVAGVGSGRDPLRSFVASLDRVASLAGVTQVLPAHGHPFTDLAGRVEATKAHHEDRLDVLASSMRALGPATVETLSHELFRQARWGPMAESETYAHLEHLRLDGRAERHQERDVFIYDLVT